MQLDIIGDIHGCLQEFISLTKKLGYTWENNLPKHDTNRKLAFLGDITDRGPNSVKMIQIIATLVKRKEAFYVPGNHCNKLYRYFLGRNVQITHGLETTVAELKSLPAKERLHISQLFIQLYEQAPLYLGLDNNKLVIAHAGIKAAYIGKTTNKVKTFVLYGDITGETYNDGSPVRRDWALSHPGKPLIVYGHTPVHDVRIMNNTYNIDTGAVFGGKLTALQYPEMKIVSVPSSMPYMPEKFKNFA